VSRAGKFEFLEGMRASDLLFRAGVLLPHADRMVAELAHSREGKPSEVKRLDLGRLLSSETGSPVDLKDDALNPLLEPDDTLSVFARPDYREHRSVTLWGQVVRPGTYVLDGPKVSLRDIVQRAGGLTPEAMVQGGIFLRSLKRANPESALGTRKSGSSEGDPTNKGINEILSRLNETRRLHAPASANNGAFIMTPLLHGLQEGNLTRMVVNFPDLLAGKTGAEVDLEDGDEIIFPRKTDAAYVVGETASPFATYKVAKGMTVADLLRMAGGPTRNADTRNIRLLKADGRIVDTWVQGKAVEPGDAVLVPQRVLRDTTWQEILSALTPIAVMLNAIK
jgi:protein involved in polysaccharide export with SLBB domain